MSGCPFLPGLTIFYKRRDYVERCSPEYQQKRMQYIGSLQGDLILILNSHLPLYFYRNNFVNKKGFETKAPKMYAAQERDDSLTKRGADFASSAMASVEFLRTKGRLAIIGSNHDNGWSVEDRARYLAKQGLTYVEIEDALRSPLELNRRWISPVNSIFSRAREKYEDLIFIDPASLLCNEKESVCSALKDGYLLFSDSIHPSNRIGLKLYDAVMDEFKGSNDKFKN